MNQGREAAYILRRKQACIRCHTKRIKCLGAVPCRNCAQSNSPCIFPPSKRSGITPGTNQITNVDSGGTPSAETIANSLSAKSYRRAEKDFHSSRSNHSHDGAFGLPNYHGNPTSVSFIEQFTAWVGIQRSTMIISKDNSFDPLWPAWGFNAADTGDALIEISIEPDPTSTPLPRQTTQPVKLRLPSYNHSLHLIQVLESSVAQEQHFFRRGQLRSRLSQMHQHPAASESKDQGWLCYWLSIVALGELYSAGRTASFIIHDNSGQYDAHRGGLPGLDYYQQAVSLLQQVAEAPDMQFIETLCLLTIYAFALNKVNTAYMFVGIALRAALSLDLHRDPSTISSKRSHVAFQDLEHQKRVFWTVYYQDLLTTTSTGRPWGLLDNEITIHYADSSDLGGEAMREFGDSNELNANIELMRLRSQAYSSLYGYAGTAISPQAEISLFDFKLSDALSEQHLDKICDFQRRLIEWHSQLAPNLKPIKSSEDFIIDANHVNANIFLVYHETILCLLRPALVNCYNIWLNGQLRQLQSFPLQLDDDQSVSPSMKLHSLYDSALASARQIGSMLQWQLDTGNLAIFSYFDASYAFSAAITLFLARAMRCPMQSGDAEQQNFSFAAKDHLALDIVGRVLQYQVSMGNIPAVEFQKQLAALENTLNSLHVTLQETRSAPQVRGAGLDEDLLYSHSI